MPDLEDLDKLVKYWSDYIAQHDTNDQFSRDAGYLAGLRVCAGQLEKTLARIRANAEA